MDQHFAKLIFNFNFNLVERWDGYILNFPSHPATHPNQKSSFKVNLNPNLNPSPNPRVGESRGTLEPGSHEILRSHTKFWL